MTDITKYTGAADLSVVKVMEKINQGGRGILFIIDEETHLIGCVTDGDIRRWIISRADLYAPVSCLMKKAPVYVLDEDRDNAKYLMEKHVVSAIPVVDKDMRIIDVIFEKSPLPMGYDPQNRELEGVPVVIMAGGKGTRLYPYTMVLPKPLIPIGDIPILERIINSFERYGVDNFYLTVNYKKNMIRSYFDDIEPDYKINYIEEDEPLGTCGGLSLIDEEFDKALFVTNCDILINCNLSDVYKQHISSGNDVTIVSSIRNEVVPYGVIRISEGGGVCSMEEKPTYSYFINTGMYVINPGLIELIPKGTMFHMTQLVDKCMEAGMKVGIYPVPEDAFLDMGEVEKMKMMEERIK